MRVSSLPGHRPTLSVCGRPRVSATQLRFRVAAVTQVRDLMSCRKGRQLPEHIHSDGGCRRGSCEGAKLTEPTQVFLLGKCIHKLYKVINLVVTAMSAAAPSRRERLSSTSEAPCQRRPVASHCPGTACRAASTGGCRSRAPVRCADCIVGNMPVKVHTPLHSREVSGTMKLPLPHAFLGSSYHHHSD